MSTLEIQQMSWEEKLRAMEELWESRCASAANEAADGDACIVWRVLDCRQNPAKIKDALKRGP